jgi:hypothetical protein
VDIVRQKLNKHVQNEWQEDYVIQDAENGKGKIEWFKGKPGEDQHGRPQPDRAPAMPEREPEEPQVRTAQPPQSKDT